MNAISLAFIFNCLYGRSKRMRYPQSLVPVPLALVGTFDGDADVVGLLLRERGELGAELVEVEARDFFVELFVNHVDAGSAAAFPEVDLRERLVGEGAGHHKAGVSGGAAEVH